MNENCFHYLSGKNILVTGGAGFIGSHICSKLVEIGANVKCLDNLSTGKIENISHLLAKENFQFVEADIQDFNELLRKCDNIEIVNHQAALGSVPRSISDPLTTHKSNVNGTLNIFEVSRLKKVKLVVFASSSSVYGNSEKLPKIENEIGFPLSPYALTKLINEFYARVYNMNYNLSYIGLRYFNVFGERQDPDGPYAAVIPKFIDKLVNNEKIVINGDGRHSRDFTHVENVVYANMKAMSANEISTNQVYNVGCGEEYSLNDLVSQIKKSLINVLPSLKFEIHYGQVRNGDIQSSRASIDKIKKNLDYFVQKDFPTGIDELVSNNITTWKKYI
jgi:UDP-N-acetylglucosamine 4-epimerase